ncbi:hypothetical protein ACVWYG_003486 [Pedobacter sp. UYEF25]
MGFIKNALLGVAIYEGIKYLTKKDEFGRTKFEALKEKFPDFVEKAKSAKDDFIDSSRFGGDLQT